MRMISADIENFQAEGPVEFLAEASFREFEPNRWVDLQAVPKPHRESPAKPLKMRPPKERIDNPLACHLLHPSFDMLSLEPLSSRPSMLSAI